jgi:hypothetical protein
MKRVLIIAGFLLLVAGTSDAKLKMPGHGNFGVFYSSLSSHGEWIEVDFGYVWRPLNVRYGWRPYLYGRWVWSQHGWYWVSSEPFGWATYHYGRWSYDDYYGWIWIPDDTWGPAWVEWRYDDDYIGWAPLPPHAHFDIHVGISFGSPWNAPWHYWNFVSCRNFTRSHVVDYVQPSERSRRIFGRTRSTGEIRYDGDRIVNRGIDRKFVERRGRTSIEETEIVTNERERSERIIRDGGRNRVETYTPRFDRQGERSDSRPENVRRSDRSIRIEGMEGNRNEPDRRGNDEIRGRQREDRSPDAGRDATSGRTSGRSYTPRDNSQGREQTPGRDSGRERSYDRPRPTGRDLSPGRTPRNESAPENRSITREPRKDRSIQNANPSSPPRQIERGTRQERSGTPSRESSRPESRPPKSERRGRP